MPEGDTIFRTARTLDRALAGKRLAAFEAPRLPRAVGRPASGATITGVEPKGKHVLVHFDDGHSLHTHLGLPGSWHVYRAGERWQRPRHMMRVAITTDDGMVAVCFSAPTVELVRRRAGEPLRHARLDALGPDLCQPDPDLDDAVTRLATVVAPATEIAVALLDQRIACGVGNVYKSEVLFACGVNPFAALSEISTARRRDLLATANRFLSANLDGGRRRTVPGGLAVYGRTGRPCRRCGRPIHSRRQGVHARMTYWCPRCQDRAAE